MNYDCNEELEESRLASVSEESTGEESTGEESTGEENAGEERESYDHVKPDIDVSEESETIKPIIPQERNPRKRALHV